MKADIQQFVSEGILSTEAMHQLEAFVDEFQHYNGHTNLSAIRAEEAVWKKHIVDSLMLLKVERLNGRLLDIGTGGGLPGIPLAIARKDLDITLLDSVGKKVKACAYFIDKLGLRNARALQDRAEKIGQEASHRKKYDIVVSRATAYLPTILAWSEQFLKPGGTIMLYKTPSTDELSHGEAAAKQLGLTLAREHIYTIDGQERKLLIYTYS